MIIDGSSIAQYNANQLELVKKGGVTAINHTVTTPGVNWGEARAEMQACLDWISANPNDTGLVRTVQDLHDYKKDGKFGIIFGPQDGEFLGGSLDTLQEAYDLGLRTLQLTYQNRNCIGDGCGVEDAGGLTPFGVEAVKRMNEIGVLIDLSHVSVATGWSTLETSTKPVVYTHAQPLAVTPHHRSKPDDQIRAIAETGGVMGMAAASSLTQRIPGKQPTLDDFFFHLQYVVDLVGVDHVAIGLDFDQNNTKEAYIDWHKRHPELDMNGFMFPWEEVHVEGVYDLSCWPVVVDGLSERGFNTEEINKITGENWLRVFGEVWAK